MNTHLFDTDAKPFLDLKPEDAEPDVSEQPGLQESSPAKSVYATLPDENYAREVMQLFSIGLYQLKPDGSQVLNSGKPVETYTQQNVTQLASIFTGWWFGNANDPATLGYVNQPMTNDGKYFTTGDKTFFTQTIPATASALEAMNKVSSVRFI